MPGETQQYKAQLRAQVDDATYEEVIRTSREILKALPTNVRLGSLAAALQLAALSYAEYGAAAARAMVAEAKSSQS